jgi:hypothetical protein
MSEELLHYAQICATLQEVTGKRVAQRVRADALRQAGQAHEPVHSQPNAADAHRASPRVQEDKSRIRRLGTRPQDGPDILDVRLERFHRRTSEQRDALLPPLAKHAHFCAAEVKVLIPQACELADPQSRRIGGLHDRTVAHGQPRSAQGASAGPCRRGRRVVA